MSLLTRVIASLETGPKLGRKQVPEDPPSAFRTRDCPICKSQFREIARLIRQNAYSQIWLLPSWALRATVLLKSRVLLLRLET